jgi:GNAT superfamily N-acetyltransferase
VVAATLGFPCAATDRRRLVEVAVSVAPEHRRRGLGADLVARVCGAGAARGAEGAIFEFDPRNAAIRGLVRHLGGWVTPLAASCLIPFSAPY